MDDVKSYQLLNITVGSPQAVRGYEDKQAKIMDIAAV
jgi:hypothetical protein